MKSGERGSALVEGALVMTLFVSLLAGALYTAEQFYSRQSLAEHVRWAARLAAVEHLTEPEIVSLIVYGSKRGVAGAPRFQGLDPAEAQVQLEAERVVIEVRGFKIECPLEPGELPR